MICDRITPLLPRAPISEPWLIASHVGSSSPGAASISATTASSVRAMFVPVSPSGTGYTLSRLMASWWARIVSRNVVTVSRRAATENRSSGRSSVGTATLYGGPRSRVVKRTSRSLACWSCSCPHGRVLESTSDRQSVMVNHGLSV